ncbi:hypothetical protein [Rhodanobacter ginsengiterrae]|uniref:hypothetical protein n=1 Tax=Rhodanobacter ginsengiterrae TaxID=2008451 RepID=UPI003CEC0991
MKTQLTRGLQRRLMYVENKDGDIDGAAARIGWVTFSKTGKSVKYRGLCLQRLKGQGSSGNYFDVASGQEYWVSGVKRRGSNAHPHERVLVVVDSDAVEAYEQHRGGTPHNQSFKADGSAAA